MYLDSGSPSDASSEVHGERDMALLLARRGTVRMSMDAHLVLVVVGCWIRGFAV